MTIQSFSDQMGFSISIPKPPQRIISLVPSQTELLSYLGLDDRVVGITKFCVHPFSWRSTKTVVGGTKNFNVDAIERLNPDLILGNKEENHKEGIERLKINFPVWMSDITTVPDALSMIEAIGLITGKHVEANECISHVNENLNRLKEYQGQSVLYLIWKDPWMAAGKETFIGSMIKTIGLTNVIDTEDRYPTLSLAEIQRLKPAYIFLSSEPYPFIRRHAEELRPLTPFSNILLVDGEMFSWYGSRMVKAFDYFKTLPLD
jgi:ABC-type Fe3+-hydroxamate transport system substrate-binding protein